MKPLPFLPLACAVVSLDFSFAARCAEEPDPSRLPLGGEVVLELVKIPAGTFRQGSPDSEPGRAPDETPREVTLTRDFFLGKYPVTVGQWTRFVEETRYRTEAETGTSGGYGFDGTRLVQRREFNWRKPGFPQNDEHPVTLVTFNDAKAFLAWLTRKTGRIFALPSEAQWEYACRAGTATASPGGDDAAAADAVAWHRGNADGATHPVGQKAANAWGLHDMAGNVWEWCQDWFGPYPPGAATDPVQSNSGLSDKARRVLRGGSFLKDAPACRSAARYRNDPASRNADNGFRVMTFDAVSERRVAEPPRVAPPPVATEPAPSTHGVIEQPPPAVPQGSGTVRQVEHYSPPRPSGPSIWRWGIVAVVVLIGIKVLRALFRGLGSGGTSGSRTMAAGALGGAIGAVTRHGAMRTRIAEDGFWLEGDDIPIGATIDCDYWVGGARKAAAVTWEGQSGGKFVFTGSRPESVSVSIRPGSVPGPMAADLAEDERLRRAHDEHDTSFRGHPPAY